MAGGGSGGHIAPLLSLAHALKQKSPSAKLIYIGRSGEKLVGLDKRLSIFDERYQVRSGKLRRYHGQTWLANILDIKTLMLNFIDMFKLAAGYLQSKRLLRRLEPDLVLSKGGYVALPTGLAAHRLKIPIITHDSDSVPGLANRIVGRHAALHATAQPADNYTNYYPIESIRYTGIPIDERIKPMTVKLQAQYKHQLGLPADSFVLMVTGGGLGSLTLNRKTVAMAKQFLAKPNHYIIHFCGSQHLAEVESAYEASLSPDELNRVKLMGFVADLYVYSGAADAIICRAGASSLAELAAQQKACIVIPAKFLTGGHQSKNLSGLNSKQAILQADDGISPQNLLRLVERLEQNKQLRDELGQNLGSLIRTDGAQRLAELILGFSQ